MAKERKMIGRITYVENWHGQGEHYVFEWRFEDDDEWNFECAAPLCEWKNGEIITGHGEMIHYTALTKLREWAKIGIRNIIWK